MGACASVGGVFDNYALVQGVDQVVPVDVFVPGCPPRPESLIYGIVQLQQKIDPAEVLGLTARWTSRRLIDVLPARGASARRRVRGRAAADGMPTHLSCRRASRRSLRCAARRSRAAVRVPRRHHRRSTTGRASRASRWSTILACPGAGGCGDAPPRLRIKVRVPGDAARCRRCRASGPPPTGPSARSATVRHCRSRGIPTCGGS